MTLAVPLLLWKDDPGRSFQTAGSAKARRLRSPATAAPPPYRMAIGLSDGSSGGAHQHQAERPWPLHYYPRALSFPPLWADVGSRMRAGAKSHARSKKLDPQEPKHQRLCVAFSRLLALLCLHTPRQLSCSRCLVGCLPLMALLLAARQTLGHIPFPKTLCARTPADRYFMNCPASELPRGPAV